MYLAATCIQRWCGEIHSSVQVLSCTSAHAGATEERPTQQLAELVATIPERYCGVYVKSKGGNITLPGLTETFLNISTESGGAVSVGKIKADSCSITTQRGSITGSITATGTIHLEGCSSLFCHRGLSTVWHISVDDIFCTFSWPLPPFPCFPPHE
jgi:hypothetical protein